MVVEELPELLSDSMHTCEPKMNTMIPENADSCLDLSCESPLSPAPLTSRNRSCRIQTAQSSAGSRARSERHQSRGTTTRYIQPVPFIDAPDTTRKPTGMETMFQNTANTQAAIMLFALCCSRPAPSLRATAKVRLRYSDLEPFWRCTRREPKIARDIKPKPMGTERLRQNTRARPTIWRPRCHHPYGLRDGEESTERKHSVNRHKKHNADFGG